MYASEVDSFDIIHNNEDNSLGIYSENGIVEFLTVPRLNYSIDQLLKDYGPPDEVYFYILDILPIDKGNDYTVFLFYKSQGVLARYDGISTKGNNIHICLTDAKGQKINRVNLNLWSSGETKSFTGNHPLK